MLLNKKGKLQRISAPSRKASSIFGMNPRQKKAPTIFFHFQDYLTIKVFKRYTLGLLDEWFYELDLKEL